MELVKTRGWEGLHPMSRALYKDTYFLPSENYSEWVVRVSSAYENNKSHGKRIEMYIRNYYFHPSTPPSSNAGTDRGLPISCFTKTVSDDKPSIFSNYNEAFNLGAYGGGIGTDWSSVREINHSVGTHGGTSSGIIPFMGISDKSTLAISQGGLRRASEAVYLNIAHPEIEEFIDLRKPTGDQNRRATNLHHGVVITDAFMDAVVNEKDWDLISPKDNSIVKTVKAKHLWEKLLEVRFTLKGEPYLLYIDTVNSMSPEEYKKEGILVTTSNLCAEIALRTDAKNSGVCCLSSINLEYWDEYQEDFDLFIADCTDYLDNMLQDFIDKTENLPGFERARAGAIDERSLGLGVMGFHSLLQSKMIPWESAIAQGLNMKIFAQIKQSADTHNTDVCEGPIGKTTNRCPMSRRADLSLHKRNIHITAVAPTMSISSLCDVTSSGIEPWVTNAFTKKVKQGSFAITNKYLQKVIADYVLTFQPATGSKGLTEKYITTAILSNKLSEDSIWASIKKNNGSVQHLEWMSQDTKDVFKTAFEIDQKWVIEFAGDRQKFIDQSQSVNLFISGGSDVQEISDLHILAWKKKMKSLYYLRSSVTNRASTGSTNRKTIQIDESDLMADTCLGCG